MSTRDGKRCAWFLALCVAAASAPAAGQSGRTPIDRHAVVTRHNIEWNHLGGRLPIGNGEFCFGADATGLQTFSGNTMSHWGWHSFPLPEGFKPEDLPPTGNESVGRMKGAWAVPAGKEALYRWNYANPHSMDLGRLQLCRTGGAELVPGDVAKLSRKLDLWSGTQTSSFEIGGQPVRVVTCVHPTLDMVAVRIESPLIERGELTVSLDFPYPSLRCNTPWVGNWTKPDAHTTTVTMTPDARRADFVRTVDADEYHVRLEWSGEADLQQAPSSKHRFVLSPKAGNVLEIACAFSAKPVRESLPEFARTEKESAKRWEDFWKSGGAIDLSGSKDPRWKELERRVVLSQYIMATQAAGSFPCAEVGLMGMDGWVGEFHMEMVWWHLAHYGLWDRWGMAERALGCYERFLPVARQLARQFECRGAKWGKMVGPEGRTSTWSGSFVLHWQQPHPIFFAELAYRLDPQRALEKWKEIVFETADYMADFPTLDEKTGLYSLVPIMPPSEQGITRDTVFDLAYWRWGLDKAQEWRHRLGMAREPHWDKVRNHLAPLPEADGVFVHSAEWKDTYTRRAWEHPDPVGVFGMLPQIEGVDPATADRTVRKVWETWNWNRCWGWDFPWMAMAAARIGQPQMAVDALLKESNQNRYPVDGINNGWYLPGNGGLLYAVAMMAAGWDGAPTRNAPGFPDDGSWVVKWEGLKAAP